MSLLKELNYHETVLKEREKILLKSEDKAPSLSQASASGEIEKWQNSYSTELAILRDWIKKQPHLPQGMKDIQILAFLHSCKYSIEQTKAKIDTHFTLRTHTPEIFTNRCLKSKQMLIAQRVTRISPLQNGTPEGYNAIYVDSMDPDVSHFDFLEAVKVAALVIDALVLCFPKEEGNVLIFDMKNSALAHVAKTNLGILKKSMIYVQKALPFLLKEVHVINAFPLIHHIQMLIKPFIDDSLSKLIHIHMQDNMDSFYKFIPKKHLPKDYGGEAKSLQELNEEMNEMLLHHEDTLKVMESWVVDESKRSGKGPGNGELDMMGSFKKLEID